MISYSNSGKMFVLLKTFSQNFLSSCFVTNIFPEFLSRMTSKETESSYINKCIKRNPYFKIRQVYTDGRDARESVIHKLELAYFNCSLLLFFECKWQRWFRMISQWTQRAAVITLLLRLSWCVCHQERYRFIDRRVRANQSKLQHCHGSCEHLSICFLKKSAILTKIHHT